MGGGPLSGLHQFQQQYHTQQQQQQQQRSLNHMLTAAQMQQQQQQKVKVKCESCGVLLEVGVPAGHEGTKMIVRCGNCTSLLEVILKTPEQQQQQQQMLAANGGWAPGSGGFSQVDSMAYFQQQQQQKQQASQGGVSMQQLSQYNMLQHPNLSFENMRSDSIQEQIQREQNLCMLMSMTTNKGAKRGYPDMMGGAMAMDSAAMMHLHGAGAQVGGRKRTKRAKDPNRPKKLSEYNKFVSREVKRMKQLPNKLSYKEMFKLAAVAWKTSPMNPNYKGFTGPRLFALVLDLQEGPPRGEGAKDGKDEGGGAEQQGKEEEGAVKIKVSFDFAEEAAASGETEAPTPGETSSLLTDNGKAEEAPEVAKTPPTGPAPAPGTGTAQVEQATGAAAKVEVQAKQEEKAAEVKAVEAVKAEGGANGVAPAGVGEITTQP